MKFKVGDIIGLKLNSRDILHICMIIDFNGHSYKYYPVEKLSSSYKPTPFFDKDSVVAKNSIVIC